MISENDYEILIYKILSYKFVVCLRFGSSAVFKTYYVEKQDHIQFATADFQRQNLVFVLVIEAKAPYYYNWLPLNNYNFRKKGLFLSTLSNVCVTCALNLPKVFFTPVSSEEKKEIKNYT